MSITAEHIYLYANEEDGAIPHALVNVVRDSHGDTALHLAAERGSFCAVQRLLDEGADPTAENNQGNTPLHVAAYRGNLEISQLLLDEGADPTATNKNGDTPLHRAAYGGNLEISQLLLDEGADLTATNKNGDTPLHRAAAIGKVGAIQLLLDKGADPTATNKNGDTPLHLAADSEEMKVIEALLPVSVGVDPNLKNRNGKTLLHLAAEHGYIELIRTLLLMGADLNAKDRARNTVLHWAIGQKHDPIINLLLEAHADLSIRDGFRQTPLLLAAYYRYIDLIRTLLNAGANLWEERIATERATDFFVDEVLDALNDAEESMLAEPFNWTHLNFNGFPQARIDDLEDCLEKLAEHYKKHPEKLKQLKSLCLGDLFLSPRGTQVLADVIENAPLTHLSLANTYCAVAEQTPLVHVPSDEDFFKKCRSSQHFLDQPLLAQALLKNKTITELNISFENIPLEIVTHLIEREQLEKLTLLDAALSQEEINALDTVYRELDKQKKTLPHLFLHGDNHALVRLMNAPLRDMTTWVMPDGSLRKPAPSLKASILHAIRQTFLAPPKTVVLPESTPADRTSLLESSRAIPPEPSLYKHQ